MKTPKLSILSLSMMSIMMTTTMTAQANEQGDELPHVTPHVVLEPVTISVSGVGRSLESGAGSITSISADEMRQIGATDMAGVVKYQPLVSAPKATKGSGNAWDSTGTTGYNIRGMDGNRVGLDVDGVELPDVSSKPDALANNDYGIGRDYIDPEMFREVRIQAGSTDARTDGLAGRVSFLTKQPSDYLRDGKSVAYGYKVGYDGADKSRSHAIHAAMGDEKWQSLVIYSRRDGKETQTNTHESLEPADWQSDAVLAKLRYLPNDTHEFGVVVDYYKKTGELVFDGQSASNLYPNGGTQNSNVERMRYGLDWVYTPSDIGIFDRLTTQTFYQTAKNGVNTHADYVSRGTTAQREWDTALHTDTYGIKWLADKWTDTGRWAHAIQYGMDVSTTDEKRPWTQMQTSSAGVVTTTKNNRMPSMQTDKFALHISDKITTDVKGRELTVAPQLRFVYQKHKPTDLTDYLPMTGISQAQVAQTVQSSTNDYLSPGLMLSYQLTPQMLGYAKYNRSARLPISSEKVGVYDGSNIYVRYAVLGNPKLKAETSDAFELGLKGQITDGVSVALSGFYNKYQDYIDYRALTSDELPTGFNLAYQVHNVADVDIWGGELGVKVDLGRFIKQSDGFSMVMGVGASNYAATNTTGERVAIDSVQPAKATLGFGYDDPNDKYGMGLTSSFVAGRRSDNGENFYRAGGYHVMDLATYWNINKNTRLNVGINNLFDKKYHDYATVSGMAMTDTAQIERASMPERNISASLAFSF
ncbi:Heme-repressible hemoglobin-binding protein [Moraxella lacunata]|uniref:Heme-repressible hemoglobin-binding protein n=1 Tax=Moraxella lacunata TaxID=477 RepID=A0A378T8H4_MORLA|nr:TonB-dependent receptor [Moraxella lacunata]STZ56447.1 Heme-repressible hemoglobin-binding protein [Moraxella lacunata]